MTTKTIRQTSAARLDGKSPDMVLAEFTNRLLAAAVRNPDGTMKQTWATVTCEGDIVDLVEYYSAKMSFHRGCVGESIARDGLQWIASNRDRKSQELGTFYK